MASDEIDFSGDRSKSKRRIFVAVAFVSIFAVCILVGLWARNSMNADVKVNGNVTTTTDPFAHIDRNQSTDEPATDENVAASNSTSADMLGIPQPSGWTYSNSFDQVRGQSIYEAAMDSENSVNFDFPYRGGSTLTLTVRRHPEYGDDVIFKISKGQFTCGVEDCSGTINFGSEPESFSLSEPTDGSSDTLFAANGSYIIQQLQKTKNVIVELPFYQEGNRQFIFEMKRPLAWPPMGSDSKQDSNEAENSISAD